MHLLMKISYDNACIYWILLVRICLVYLRMKSLRKKFAYQKKVVMPRKKI